MLQKIELNVLREEWKNLQRMLNNVISLNISDESVSYEGSTLYGKIESLTSTYNNLINRTKAVLKSAKIELSEEVLPRYLPIPSTYNPTVKKFYLLGWKAKNYLNLMAGECSKTLTLISGLVAEISLSPSKEEELKTLENEIKDKIEQSFPLYSSELIQSINSLRKGELLGSALICGRIVTVIIDKCKKTMSKGRAKLVLKEVFEFLKNKRILDGKEGEEILNAIRLYRNKFAHQIGTYPSIEEAILIISGTALLLKKITENKDEFDFLVY
jgi:uncharacterized protein YutE (UPF0331/DUF86 family)